MADDMNRTTASSKECKHLCLTHLIDLYIDSKGFFVVFDSAIRMTAVDSIIRESNKVFAGQGFDIGCVSTRASDSAVGFRHRAPFEWTHQLPRSGVFHSPAILQRDLPAPLVAMSRMQAVPAFRT